MNALAGMLAAWRWTGALAPVLQCVYGPISPETAATLAGAAGIVLAEAGPEWCPASATWADEPWHLVTIQLSARLGVEQGLQRLLIVPQSASLELVAHTLMALGRELVLDDVRRTEATFSTATTPARSWLACERGPDTRTVATPIKLDDMHWTGPR